MHRRRALQTLLAAACLAPIRAGATEAYSSSQALMGTRFKLTCYTNDHDTFKRVAQLAFAEAQKINRAASDYIANSELLSFSQKEAGRAHQVSPLLFRLLVQAREFAARTKGAFDPTLGPLSVLWRQSRRKQALPSAAKLRIARAASGYQKLQLDPKNQTLIFTVPGMRLDLGGIAKGQAADAMFAIFKQHGLASVSISCGGDVMVGDPPPGRPSWNIEARSHQKRRTLHLTNAAVSTSGDLHQFLEIDGQRYSHILDPSTGLGLIKPSSATIIASTSAEADAMATAACVRA